MFFFKKKWSIHLDLMVQDTKSIKSLRIEANESGDKVVSTGLFEIIIELQKAITLYREELTVSEPRPTMRPLYTA